MVTAEVMEMGEGELDRDRYYHPARIADWLEAWPDLTARAERVGAIELRLTPASTRHLFADAGRWAIVQADILAAWDSLGPGTLEYRLVYLILYGRHEHERYEFGEGEAGEQRWRSYLVATSAALIGVDANAASQLYWRAARRMARHLGWGPADE